MKNVNDIITALNNYEGLTRAKEYKVLALSRNGVYIKDDTNTNHWYLKNCFVQ